MNGVLVKLVTYCICHHEPTNVLSMYTDQYDCIELMAHHWLDTGGHWYTRSHPALALKQIMVFKSTIITIKCRLKQ